MGAPRALRRAHLTPLGVRVDDRAGSGPAGAKPHAHWPLPALPRRLSAAERRPLPGACRPRSSALSSHALAGSNQSSTCGIRSALALSRRATSLLESRRRSRSCPARRSRALPTRPSTPEQSGDGDGSAERHAPAVSAELRTPPGAVRARSPRGATHCACAALSGQPSGSFAAPAIAARRATH